MGLFTRVTPESLKPILLRICRLEGARHATEKFRSRSPFSEERTRLFSLMAQDQQISPETLASRVAAGSEALTEAAIAWQQSIDVAQEQATLDGEIAALGRKFKKLLPVVSQYVSSAGKFGPKVADQIQFRFRQLGCYFSFSPARRGFLFGQIRQTEIAGQPIEVLDNEVMSGRYNHTFIGHCDKVWQDLTYLRPSALAYSQALARQVLSGDCSVETVYLRKALGLFNQQFAGDHDQFAADLEWWAIRELRARQGQRQEIRRRRTSELIQQETLAEAGYQEDFYWIFEGAMAELEVLLELQSDPSGERLRTARWIDRLIHFEPPISEAAFYYDQGLLLLHAHLTDDPARTLADQLRGLEDFEEYHTLMRNGWDRIQAQLG